MPRPWRTWAWPSSRWESTRPPWPVTREALELEPYHADALIKLAVLLEELGRQAGSDPAVRGGHPPCALPGVLREPGGAAHRHRPRRLGGWRVARGDPACAELRGRARQPGHGAYRAGARRGGLGEHSQGPGTAPAARRCPEAMCRAAEETRPREARPFRSTRGPWPRDRRPRRTSSSAKSFSACGNATGPSTNTAGPSSWRLNWPKRISVWATP